jgi:hypothetical protein
MIWGYRKEQSKERTYVRLSSVIRVVKALKFGTLAEAVDNVQIVCSRSSISIDNTSIANLCNSHTSLL